MGKLEFDLLPTEQKRALMKQAHRELKEAAQAPTAKKPAAARPDEAEDDEESSPSSSPRSEQDNPSSL